MKRIFCALLALALLCLPVSAETLARANTQTLGSEESIANAKLAADSVYDTTLTTGDVFSFNDTVGPRSQARGYVSAENGSGVRVVGGGVAAVASAIYLAAKNTDDITVVEVSNYGSKYTGSYVESRSDAVLVDYDSGRDFRLKYTGEGAITIDTWVEDGCVYCEIVREG